MIIYNYYITYNLNNILTYIFSLILYIVYINRFCIHIVFTFLKYILILLFNSSSNIIYYLLFIIIYYD